MPDVTVRVPTLRKGPNADDGVVGKNTWAALLKTYFAGSLPG